MAILKSRRIHPAYKMTWWKKLKLGLRFSLNGIRIQTGTTYKTHLAMALKLLETPPEVMGDVIECGTWKGGSAANLSLACRIVGRKLRIFDSFEGLPAGDSLDREAKFYKRGDYAGSLDEVQTNIEKYGAPECCEYVRGWFNDTLPQLNSPWSSHFSMSIWRRVSYLCTIHISEPDGPGIHLHRRSDRHGLLRPLLFRAMVEREFQSYAARADWSGSGVGSRGVLHRSGIGDQ